MASWVYAGSYLIDTGEDDSADPARGFVYQAVVRPTAMYRSGGPNNETYRWLTPARVAIGTPFYALTSDPGTLTPANAGRRIFIVVDAWLQFSSGYVGSTLKIQSWDWRLIRSAA